MMSLPKFYFLEPEPLIKAMVKTAKVHINLGSWQGLSIIAIGPRNGKIVGYGSAGKPIYAGSAAAQKLVDILQAKHTYTPAQQDVALVKWLMELGLKGAVDAQHVHLSKEGAQLLQESFSVAPQALGGGKWAVSKALLLPHLGEPLKPSEEDHTGWAAEMASGQYGDGSFPPMSELTELPAGKFAGSHGNLLFVDKGGHKWVFKASNPTIARAEEAACRLGRLLLGDLIPAVKYVEVKGKGGALIQILEGKTWQESSSQHSDPQIENLKKYKELIIKHQVVDWLVSNHDSHAGNFLSQGDQLAAIDKGQSWKFLGKDKLEADYSPNPSHPIYNKFWENISEGVIDPEGLIEAVAVVVNRADQISPEQFQLIVAPYVSTASGWTHADPKVQLQEMLSRLQNLRSDFEGFLSKELGKKVVLPKPETVQVAWEVAPGEKPAAPAVKKLPIKLEIPLAPAAPVIPDSPAKLKEVETVPVTAEKPAAGWPLTKKGPKGAGVTIHTPGFIPASWWPPGIPAPGLKLSVEYKGKTHSLEVKEHWEGKKPTFLVTYPDGGVAAFPSLNAAGDSLYLFNQGLPLTLSATEKKAKGISLGSKVFQLKLFEKELSEASGKQDEPVPVAVATPVQLEEQKVIEPEQPKATAFQLLAKAHPENAVLSMYDPALPQEVKEFLLANSGGNQLSPDWDLAMTPGQVAVAKHDFFGGPVILAAKLSKEGKPELWGWWEDAAKGQVVERWGGSTAKVMLEAVGLKNNAALAEAKKGYEQAVALELKSKAPIGPPPAVELPENAVVPPSAPKFTEGPLSKGTVIKVKKKVPGYDKKQEVTLTVLQNGQLLVEIPGQTAQTFQTLSAASDHVWVVQKGFTDAADYKAKNKTNKVPSGGGWKFWGISPAATPVVQTSEPGVGGAVAPAVGTAPVPVSGEAPAPAPTGTVEPKGGKFPTDLEAFYQLPVGTSVQTKSSWGATTIYVKESDDKWMVTFESGESQNYDDVQALGSINGEALYNWNLGLGPLPVPEKEEEQTFLPAPLPPPSLEQIKAYPLGTKVHVNVHSHPSYVYVKTAAGWSNLESGNTYKDLTVANSWKQPFNEITKIEVPEKEEKPGEGGLQAQLELLIKTGDFAFLPKNTVIQSESKSGAIQYKYVKESDNFWKTYSDGINVGSFSSYVVATELKDEVITSWKKPGGAAFTPETESTPAEEVPPEVPSVGNQVELVNQIKASAKLAGISGFEDIIKALIALPPGIVLKTEGTMGQEYQYQKQADGSWATISGGLNLVTGIPPGSLAVDLKHEIITAFTPAGQPVVPEKDKAAKGAPPLLMKPVADFPKDDLGTFKKLPIGTSVVSTTSIGHTWTHTKVEENSWEAKSSETGIAYPAIPDQVVFTDMATETVVTFGVPDAQSIPATWEEFDNLAWGKMTAGPVHKTISDYAQYLNSPAGFSAIPVGTVINTEHKTGNTYEYTKLAPDAWEIVSGGGHKYAYHDSKALSDIQNETILGWKQSMEAPGLLKPVEQMTPAEKMTKVKVNMPFKQALKVHPGLQEGKLKIKKAKGSGMYICLDGVPGASTKLYTALQDLGMTHVIKNTGGIPKINAQGAFVTVDGFVLDQEVTVETTALDASSEQHAPSDPNWQTMPKAKAKPKKSKAQKEAEQKSKELQAKAAEIKAWGEQHPPVTDKTELQVLAALQGAFDKYEIPVGAIARMDGDQVILGHKTHQAQLDKLVVDLADKAGFIYETVSTPWGDAFKLSIQKVKEGVEQATGMVIGGMISGPDGKEYPAGTTFQKKVVETTVEQLLPGEPGFYKIKEHKNEPLVLALIKIAGNGEEQIAQMKAMIEKYELKGPFPEPKVTDNSTIHSVYKTSLQKVWKTEETYESTIPKQLPDFVQGSLPYSEAAGLWEEVGDGSADLHNIDGVKSSLFGAVLRIGAPGELRDFCIRYRKVKDASGKLHHEFTGDLVSISGTTTKLKTGTVKFGATLGKTISGLGGTASKVLDYDPDTGIHTESSPVLEDGPNPLGWVGLTDNGSSIAVIPPSTSQDTFKNTFRVRIPVGLDPVAELREAFQKMGKDPDKVLAPLNADSDRICKKSMLVRGMMGAAGWNEDSFAPALMHNEPWLDEKLGKLGAKTQVKSLRVMKTFDNQVTVVADDAEKFKSWDFAYVGSKAFATTLQLLQGSGWSSRRNRLMHGIWNGGQSASTDFKTGGSKGTFFRIAGGTAPMSNSYECQIIVHPRVFQRTDWWRYNTDGYGNTSSHAHHGGGISASPTRNISKLNSTNEILFEGGVAAQDIVAVVVNYEDNRDKMIAALKKAGMTELNGKPVEEVIILPTHKGHYAYGDSTAFAKLLGLKKDGE